MRVSYNWLTEYINLEGIDPYELADRLTNSGIAVDVVEKRNQGIEKVVIGYVSDRVKHPDAEKLSVCMVDVGLDDKLQIVCGAANVDAGQMVAVATVGAKLPGGIKIKKTKLRGVTSEGMICSAKELGMNEKLLLKGKSEGILVLSNNAPIGEEIDSFLGFDDYVLELDLTPNRSDCLSMLGVAYEVGAILDREVTLPEGKLGTTIDNSQKIKIEIEAKDDCSHYAARLLTDVTIKESPQWLQNSLIAAGIRPISNVVDITNYVLLEYGQPLHAFDFDQLGQPNILVRKAYQNEKMFTLDDQERLLDEEMLLITDGVNPIAIAGVMGGANSEVTSSTTKILLESAYFNGSSIRKTSKKLGLRSEASLRFEKGVDPNRIYAALNRATELLQELADAKLDGEIYEDVVIQPKEEEIILDPKMVNKFLGTNISIADIQSVFRRLGFTTSSIADDILVKVPTRRQDITIAEDLYEEIARIHGYDNIPTTLPSGMYIQGGLTNRQNLRRKVKGLMEAVGLNEVITYSFANLKQHDLLERLCGDSMPIKLAMPLSEEREYLRTTILPNLLDVAQYNMNRRISDIRIFEMGVVFAISEEILTNLPQEKLLLSGLLTGSLPKNWQNKDSKIDFYYVKGILEELFVELGLDDITYDAKALEGYHPGRTAEIKHKGTKVGHIGQLHPNVMNQYDLKETYIFEIDLGELLSYANNNIKYQELPKYPAIQRDMALVVSKDLEANDLAETIYESAGKLLESLSVFDVYEGEQIGKGKKSIAFSLVYRSNERTLVDEEVTKLHEKVLNTLKEKYGLELRR